MAFFYMLDGESTPMTAYRVSTERRKTMSMLLTISYFCIFRYINKAGLYIPPNIYIYIIYNIIYIYIFILSKLAVCSLVLNYSYTSFHLTGKYSNCFW